MSSPSIFPATASPAAPRCASVETLADWIPALLDAAGIGRASLVGHSLGSLAALECAARGPERVAKLVLIGPAAPMPVSEALQDAAKRNDHLACELITGWSYSAGEATRRQPGARRLAHRQCACVFSSARDRACFMRISRVRSLRRGQECAARVRCPALVIVGARDIMAPPKNAQGLIAALPDAKVVTIPDCGHAMMAEQPDTVLDALRAFL